MCDGYASETGKKRASGESRKPRSSRIRIIGLGNAMRGDDAVGLLVARQVRQTIGDRAEVLEAEMAGVELIHLIEGAGTVILVDAMCSGQQPGTAYRLDASTGPIAPQMFPCSSHEFGVSETVELGRVLGVLPSKLILYGIEAGAVATGQGLSAPVAKAVDHVVELIIQECDVRHA